MSLSGENKERRICRVHVEIGNNLELIEVFYFKEMGLIEDGHRDLLVICYIGSDAVLTGVEQLGLSVEGFSSQQYRELSTEVQDIDSGKLRRQIVVDYTVKSVVKMTVW